MPYGSGTTPRKSDTKLMLLTKQLNTIQAFGGFAANNAARNDTIRRIRVKLVRAKSGLNGPNSA